MMGRYAKLPFWGLLRKETGDAQTIAEAIAAMGGGGDRNIEIIIDGGGSAITTGIKGDIEVSIPCTIAQVTLMADVSGSIKIDIWKNTYANFPPTNANTICGANEPEISAGVKDQDSTLTAWTKAIAAGDILRFNVDSCATITRCTLSLKVTPA